VQPPLLLLLLLLPVVMYQLKPHWFLQNPRSSCVLMDCGLRIWVLWTLCSAVSVL
jgi:hypothetical protein